jgi:hypothetical protein
MPMIFLFQQSQEGILILLKKLLKTNIFILIGIFYPKGEPISPHRYRCSPFAVVEYNFMSHCLVAAAISAREYSR